MRFYDLPYFKSLVGNPDKFFTLMSRLNETNSDAAGTLIEMMHLNRNSLPGMGAFVKRFAYSMEARLYDGEVINTIPMLIGLNFCNYFGSQSLPRLRRLISQIDKHASDADDAIEWMKRELDLTTCDDCGEWEFADCERSVYSGADVCRDCIEDSYLYVDRYDLYVWSDSVVQALNEYGDRIRIHQEDEYFVWSDDLNIRVHVDYEYARPEPEVIGGYHSSKSQIRFQRDDWTAMHKRFLGVELEVEMADRYAETRDKARQLNELINKGEVGKNVFFERDGSLTNGFEVVTHPMSLPAHRELWKWLQDKGATKGLISHKSTTCGLHVHVNRESLTKLQIAKIVAFVNNPANEEFMTALARRYGSAMTGYCRIKAEKAKVKKPESSDRYEAVNVTPRHTIEFRIFKGTLKYESLVAAVEFVHALCEYTARCGDCSASDLGYESFLKFAETKLPKETKTLRTYVNNRLETV